MLKLESLHLWTFCSQQKFSSVILERNKGHLLIDGFQMDALFNLLQAITLAADNGPFAIMLPAMLSEAYLNANDFGMADALMGLAVAGARRFPAAISGLRGSWQLKFQLEVQRLFVLGHEMGHLLLARSPLTRRDERAQVMQERLDYAIRFASRYNQQDSLPEIWNLRGKDERFRDELSCDTIAIDIVEAALAQFEDKPSQWRRLAFEAIYFCSFSLDLLRTLNRVASIKIGQFDAAATEALLGREFIRSVSLNLLSQSRFEISETMVDSVVERIDRVQQSEFGLLHVLRIAENQRQCVSSDAQFDNEKKAQLYSLCQWRPDPSALFEEEIY
jgi:hypothetical protein